MHTLRIPQVLMSLFKGCTHIIPHYTRRWLGYSKSFFSFVIIIIFHVTPSLPFSQNTHTPLQLYPSGSELCRGYVSYVTHVIPASSTFTGSARTVASVYVRLATILPVTRRMVSLNIIKHSYTCTSTPSPHLWFSRLSM